MIRNVLVMKSGLVLFSREFANTVQQVRESETKRKVVLQRHEDTDSTTEHRTQNAEHQISLTRKT